MSGCDLSIRRWGEAAAYRTRSSNLIQDLHILGKINPTGLLSAFFFLLPTDTVMLSSWRRSKGRSRKDRSPYSSPRTGLPESPVAARRDPREERRRPARNFDYEASPAPVVTIEEEGPEEDDDVEDEDEEMDEDGDAETTPLLPIFSAAHLGIFGLPTYAQRCGAVL